MIGYVIQCYSNLAQVPRLIEWLSHPENFFVVSINPRTTDTFDLGGALAYLPNVKVITSVPVTWGGDSFIAATFDAVRELLAFSSSWQFVFNLSEHCFPVRPQNELFRFLEENRRQGITEYVSSFGPIERTVIPEVNLTDEYEQALQVRGDTQFWSDRVLHQYFVQVQHSPVVNSAMRASIHASESAPGLVYCRPLRSTEKIAREHFFARSPLYIGRVWFGLSRETASWVVNSATSCTNLELLKSVFIPDECFLQTVMNGPDAPVSRDSISQAGRVWYRSGGPQVVTDHDYDDIMSSGVFFARKLVRANSPRLVGCADSLNADMPARG